MQVPVTTWNVFRIKPCIMQVPVTTWNVFRIKPCIMQVPVTTWDVFRIKSCIMQVPVTTWNVFHIKPCIMQVPITKAYGVIHKQIKQTAQCSSIVIGYFRPPVRANKGWMTVPNRAKEPSVISACSKNTVHLYALLCVSLYANKFWSLSVSHVYLPTLHIYTFTRLRHMTNFAEHSPPWEAIRSSASQELPRILWIPKRHHHIPFQAPATCPYFNLQQSSPCLHIPHLEDRF
jgi:hypothetical protein